MDDLRCEDCDKHIGWVYDFDLNGSHFWCDECHAKLPSTKPQCVPNNDIELMSERLQRGGHVRLSNFLRGAKFERKYLECGAMFMPPRKTQLVCPSIKCLAAAQRRHKRTWWNNNRRVSKRVYK